MARVPGFCCKFATCERIPQPRPKRGTTATHHTRTTSRAGAKACHCPAKRPAFQFFKTFGWLRYPLSHVAFAPRIERLRKSVCLRCATLVLSTDWWRVSPPRSSVKASLDDLQSFAAARALSWSTWSCKHIAGFGRHTRDTL